MKPYMLSFVSLFVAMDVIGTLPIFLSLTERVEERLKRRVTLQAVLTGGLVGLLFLYLGQWLFRLLGITVADFRVAGGLILLVFAIHDLLFSSLSRRKSSGEATLGVVPIGIPLLVGPAVLTGLLLSADRYGHVPTLVALGLNLAIALLVFGFSRFLIRVLGEAGSKGVGKVASLLLAAIAVMMIRSGVEAMLG
ncbi:MAG: MarC family protein [Deltaproteobacteria bacterium]|nr:MarC family protein [Deltaproteobacteria bacterium]